MKTWKPQMHRGFMTVFKGHGHDHGLKPGRIRRARAKQLEAAGWPVLERRDKKLRTQVFEVPDEAYEVLWDMTHKVSTHHPEWAGLGDMLRVVGQRLQEGASITRLSGSDAKVYDWVCMVVKEELNVEVDGPAAD